jgi:hypothetical protein
MNIHYLISMLFEARTKIHFAHLNTTAYARHVALGSYYEGLTDYADKLAEVWLSCNAERLRRVAVKIPNEPEAIIDCLNQCIEAIYHDSHHTITNILDDLLNHNQKTSYLLTIR